MKLVPNSGADRVFDLVRPHLKPGSQLGCVTPSFSLFAYAELRDALAKLEGVQLILPPGDNALEFLGGEGDRANRNRLQARWLANQCATWLTGKVDLRRAHGRVPQGTAVMRDAQGAAEQHATREGRRSDRPSGEGRPRRGGLLADRDAPYAFVGCSGADPRRRFSWLAAAPGVPEHAAARLRPGRCAD